MFGLIYGGLFAVALAQSPCEEPASSSDLIGAMEVAENAWSMADADGFNAATVSVDSLLPCLEDPVSRATAARIHRVQGMNAFLRRDSETMQRSFAAARYVQPGWSWPADLVPPGHPVHKQYVALSIDNPDLEQTLLPRDGNSWFDGREGLARPTGWPTVHQLVSDDGNILGTWLIAPEQTVPDYPRKSPAATVAAVQDSPDRGVRLPILLGAGAGYATSALLYGLAAQSSSKYRSGDPQSVQELDQLRSATNGRYWASMGLIGASTATTVGAFALARW